MRALFAPIGTTLTQTFLEVPIMSDTLIKLMLKLKYDLKLTGLVVTHDLDLMRKVADRVMFLYEGKAIYFGAVKDLEKSDHPHIREFLAMDRVELVPGQ